MFRVTLNAMIKTCAICGKEFDAARSDARTCSPACRQRLYRLNRGQSVTGLKLERGADGELHVVHTNRKPDIRYHVGQLRDAAAKVMRETDKVTEARTRADGTTRKPTGITYLMLQSTLRDLIEAEQAIRALGVHTADEDAAAHPYHTPHVEI